MLAHECFDDHPLQVPATVSKKKGGPGRGPGKGPDQPKETKKRRQSEPRGLNLEFQLGPPSGGASGGTRG